MSEPRTAREALRQVFSLDSRPGVVVTRATPEHMADECLRELAAQGFVVVEAAAPSLTVERRLRHLCDLIVSYADLTHRVVWEGGDWRDIAHEWNGVVAQARADLVALTPSSEEPA